MNQPDKYARQDLVNIIDNAPEIVVIADTKHRVKIRPLHPYTLERLTGVWSRRDISRPTNAEQTTKELLKDPYFNHKMAALFVLNGFFKINLFHGILWRWYAYVKGYCEYQLTDIIVAGKKKNSATTILSEYNINAGYESRLDDDDDKGSRPIPSRTYIGRKYSFVKEYPEYGRTRYFFFGLIAVKEYGYRCLLTNPEIDLAIDIPHIQYNPISSGGPKLTTADYKHCTEVNDALTRAFIEKQKNKANNGKE